MMLDNYNPPNLSFSCRRRPAGGYHRATIRLQTPLSQEDGDTNALAAAIAVCFGQWSSVQDILLGRLQPGGFIPIRIKWSPSDAWNKLLQSVVVGSKPLSRGSVLSELQLEREQEPFAAIFATQFHDGAQLGENHPIFFQLLEDGQTLALRSAINCFALPVTELCLQLIDNILMVLKSTRTDKLDAGFLGPDSSLLSVDSREPHLLPPYKHVMQWVDEWARERPDIPSVIYYEKIDSNCPKQQLSYRELSCCSSQMAEFLVDVGITPGDKIAVCMKRNLDFHVTLLGILKAGACYVPIDRDLPVTRRKFIAEDSGAKFVLVDAGEDTGSDFSQDTVLRFPSYQELSDHDEAFTIEIDPSSLSYLLYTSGTTGNPKGCLLTHRGLHVAICSMGSHCENVTDQDKWLGLASVAFDVHLTEVLTPWMLGFATASAPRSELLEDLAAGIEFIGATHVCCVPSLIEATFGGLKNGVGQVKYLISGGEKITDNILENWASRPDLMLMNFYGPSEVTIGCTCRPMDEIIAKENIGRVFPGARSFVVSPDLQILPRGCVGELIIEGPLVGDGYHNRADLTAKSFIEWPHHDSRAFRTGDLVRMLPDGSLEILGRADNQIKLRGVRIESEGISHVFRTAAEQIDFGSIDAYTFLGQHPSFNSQQLVTLVAPLDREKVPMTVKKGDDFPTLLKEPAFVRQLREVARAELATYMVPAHIIVAKWLPISSNGKADDKLMRSFFASLDVGTLGSLTQEMDGQDAEGSIITDTEERLRNLIVQSSSLSPDEIKPTSNYFSCGLDSLKLIRISAAIHKEFGVVVSASELMREPTLRSTAEIVRSGNETGTASGEKAAWEYLDQFSQDMRGEIESLRPIFDIEAVYPTFPVQEGVLFSSLDDTTQYAQHFIFKLHESVNLPRLLNAWRTAQTRFEILRATFHFGASKLGQIILLPDACATFWAEHFIDKISVARFLHLFHQENAASILRSIRENADLEPPFRLNVYRTGNVTYMVLSIHHALYDGTSLPIILRTVADIYEEHDEPTDAQPLKTYLHALALPKSRNPVEFWRSYLTGAGTVQPRTIISTVKPCTITRKLELSLTLVMKKASEFHVTPNALLISIFGSIMSPEGLKEMTIGHVRSGRAIPVPGAEQAPIPLVNVIPLRIQTLQPLDAAAQTTHEHINEMQEFEGIPLGRIQHISHHADQLFDILFSMHFEDAPENRLWKLVDTSPDLPPDCILACEIAANAKADSLTMTVVFRETDVSSEEVDQAFGSFNTSLHDLRPNKQMRRRGTRPPPVLARVESSSSGLATPGGDHPISRIVCDFLGVSSDHCGPTTSLLSLGLDSIKAVSLSRKLRNEGFSISANTIMRFPSLRKIRSHVAAEVSPAKSPDVTPIPVSPENEITVEPLHPDDKVRLYFATALQNGMLSKTIASGGVLYSHYFVLEFVSSPDPDSLREAWYQIVQRNSILRTSFHFSDELGSWIQAVHSRFSPSMFSEVWASANLKSDISTFLSQTLFDSELALVEPPLRVRLFKMDNGKSIQVLRIHHALYDGISIGILLRQVQQVYLNTFEMTLSLYNFVDVLPVLLSTERKGSTFWKDYLKGAHPLKFPTQGVYPDGTVDRTLSITGGKANEICRNLEITFQSLGQAALWKILRQLFQTDDITFGHVISARSMIEMEDVMGPVLNTIPCRISVSQPEHLTNRDLVQKFHENYTQTLPFQNTSLRLIQQQTGMSNIWDTLFTFQHEGGDIDKTFWDWQHDDEAERAGVQYGLNFELTSREDYYKVRVAVGAGIMSQDDLHSVVEGFDAELALLITQLGDPVARCARSLPRLSLPKPHEETAVNGHVPISDEILLSLKSTLADCTQLPASQINANDNVVSLGVDSITALQVSSRLRKSGFRINSGEILGSASLKALAALMASRSAGEKSTHAPMNGDARPAAKSTESGPLPVELTSGMIWFIGASLAKNGGGYQHAFPYRAQGQRIDSSRARDAWRALAAHHVLLRTSFFCDDHGNPTVSTLEDFEPNWTEMTHPVPHSEKDWVEAYTHRLISQPMDPRSPPLRCSLLHLPQSDYLIFEFHHFQYDAYTLPLMIADFADLYHGSAASSDTSACVRQKAFHVSASRQQEYWQSIFPPGYTPSLFAPQAKSTPLGNSDKRHGVWRHNIGAGIAAMKRIAKQDRLTINSLYLASWASTQANFSGIADVVFGLWHSSRSANVPGIENLAFPCLNVVPMRVQMPKDPTPKRLAALIQEDLTRRNHDIEQSSLLDIDVWINGKGTALCNVFVNILHRSREEQKGGLLQPIDVLYKPPASLNLELPGRCRITELVKDDVVIDILLDEESIDLYIEANPHLMELHHVEDLAKSWEEAVVTLVKA